MARIKKKVSGKSSTKPLGSLLILACSQRKREVSSPAPALHVYDGVNYRVLRKILLEKGWPPGLQIKILSAKYGLIDATELIEPYDLRLDRTTAQKKNKNVLAELKKVDQPKMVFVNLGKDYLPALNGIERVFPETKIIFADGPIGMKMQQLKIWLNKLQFKTATIKGKLSNTHSYLYFFPDWDDYVYEPFTSDENRKTEGTKTYAHEICGSQTPFDGILLSLSHLTAKKGALHRFANGNSRRISLRKRLRIPERLRLFGDCGAFSYVNESKPSFTPEQAAELYSKYGFDIGASVDHIPVLEITIRDENGDKRKITLSESVRRKRMFLTRDNAAEFLEICRKRNYRFTPLGVIQGLDCSSYVRRFHEYLDMGYRHIAIGGLVPRSDNYILDILCAIRCELQKRTRSLRENIWLHLFGILRPKLQPLFKELGVSSFDSASYFRKAWLRSDQNYLSPDGERWYGTIRIPLSNSKPMQQAAHALGMSEKELVTLERNCLSAIEACDSEPFARLRVTRAINKYGPLLERKSEENHFAEKHAVLLSDRPWEKCTCPFCRSSGIHVIVFRGASRNKRRGLHNTWVFYHKIMHG